MSFTINVTRKASGKPDLAHSYSFPDAHSYTAALESGVGILHGMVSHGKTELSKKKATAAPACCPGVSVVLEAKGDGSPNITNTLNYEDSLPTASLKALDDAITHALTPHAQFKV